MIPKIIHYCWLSEDPYPKKIQYCIQSWKKYLPDYEIILWDRNRFDINSCLWVKQAFEAKKYAFAADYIRLYALYHYGGIYLDSDVEVVKSFDPLLQRPYFFGTENNENIRIEAATMGVEPFNNYILKCLKHYDNRAFIIDGNMDMTPLPYIMMSYIDRCLLINDECEDTFILSDKILFIYPEDYFSPKDNVDASLHKTCNTYSIHHFNGSWLSRGLKFKNFIAKCCGKTFADISFEFYFSLIECVKSVLKNKC